MIYIVLSVFRDAHCYTMTWLCPLYSPDFDIPMFLLDPCCVHCSVSMLQSTLFYQGIIMPIVLTGYTIVISEHSHVYYSTKYC